MDAIADAEHNGRCDGTYGGRDQTRDGEGKIKEAAHLCAKLLPDLAFQRAVEEGGALLGGEMSNKAMLLTAL